MRTLRRNVFTEPCLAMDIHVTVFKLKVAFIDRISTKEYHNTELNGTYKVPAPGLNQPDVTLVI
jgi:hypothetical protein